MYRTRMLAGTSLVAAAVSILVAGCAAPDRVTTAAALQSGAALNLQESLQVLAARHNVCAVAVAVVRDRKLATVDTASGCSPAVKVDGDSVFQAASLSKTVFAYAVLKLVEQGKMSLDAPVLQYLPNGYRHQFEPLKPEPSELVSDPRLKAVTVRMALNHTAGLPNWSSGPLKFNTAPGAKWDYSGEGYVLLQRAVEAVSGQPLDRFMASTMFASLGMSRSSFVWTEATSRNLLGGTKANGSPRDPLVFKQPLGAASLYTSANDYGKFMVALMNDSAALARITATPVMADAKLGLEWGLGWGIEPGPGGAALWQWGNNPGYRAFAMLSPRSGDGFVILTNGETGLKVAQPVSSMIVPGAHRLFQSSILGTDVVTTLCESVRICL